MITILMPVHNDWLSALRVVEEVDAVLAAEPAPGGEAVRIVLIDDGSTGDAPEALTQPVESVVSVEVLGLRRNLGHQRAIAVGLAWVQEAAGGGRVVVMDADGEDRPEDVPRLLAAAAEHPEVGAVFAARSRRFEPLWFRVGYRVYCALHRALTGVTVRVGNFSTLSASALERIVGVSEIWSHYAAGVFLSRIPRMSVPLPRGRRFAGRSSMDFASLVSHGLSAIAVFGERVGVRLLILGGVAMGVLTVLGITVVAAALAGESVIPLWAAIGLGFVLLGVAQVLTVIAGGLYLILSARSQSAFLPLRDYGYFVCDVRPLHAAS